MHGQGVEQRHLRQRGAVGGHTECLRSFRIAETASNQLTVFYWSPVPPQLPAQLVRKGGGSVHHRSMFECAGCYPGWGSAVDDSRARSCAQ